MTLDDLGPRIVILGPSGSGKSTLAHAIGQAHRLPVVHLDQLHHLPRTEWVPRPQAEFVALHDAAIEAPAWVIDGNYSRCLPQRLERATGVILLDVSMTVSLLRYLRRCWCEADRHGGLAGSADRVRWMMIRHLLLATQMNRLRNRRRFARIDLPKIALSGVGQIRAFYSAEGLVR